MAFNGDAQYHLNLSTKATVQFTAPEADLKDGTPTCRGQVTGTAHLGTSKAQKNSIAHVLISQQTHKEDKRNQNPNVELRNLMRNSRTRPTPVGRNSVKAAAEEHKTHEGGCDNALNRDNVAYSTLVGDRIGMYGRRNKRFVSWTFNGDDYTHLVTIGSNKKGGEESLDNTEMKLSLYKYQNQNLLMAGKRQTAYLVRISKGAKILCIT